ncbi:MAG TPA: NAD(P)-dependent alcohol dehydrogenase [Candidatus Dormibacteraeota bacterium]|nr:NAD(P)-dependent alcohol dehydrogenase [Candidatus Dormibacteraeota bacterium]
MKAIVYDRYGPPEVLRIADVPKPDPQPDEILVKIRAAGVSRADVHTREANAKSGAVVSGISRLVSGVRRPRQPILGTDFAGEVAAVGSTAAGFKVGDAVFGSMGFRFGSWAEFAVMRADRLVAPKPESLTFEQAAPVTDGGLYAQALKLAHIQPGQTVLVYGASGAIGTAGVQLAKSFGAEVTGVTTTKNLDVVRSIGADYVIDYTAEDFTKNGKTYDVIFDAVGKHSFERCKGSLKAGGAFVATDGFSNLLLTMWTRRFGDKRVIFDIPPRFDKNSVLLLKDLIDTGRYKVIIDRVYPMDDVIEACRYVETEQKVGNVVLTIP